MRHSLTIRANSATPAKIQLSFLEMHSRPPPSRTNGPSSAALRDFSVFPFASRRSSTSHDDEARKPSFSLVGLITEGPAAGDAPVRGLDCVCCD